MVSINPDIKNKIIKAAETLEAIGGDVTNKAIRDWWPSVLRVKLTAANWIIFLPN